MNVTPPMSAHRVLSPLNWDRTLGPLDGKVMIKKNDNGEKVLFICVSKRGVSFFVAKEELFKFVHSRVGVKMYGCGVTVPNTGLPANLKFTQDGPLMLEMPVQGPTGVEKVECGQHWSLLTTVQQPLADFEAAYEAVVHELVPCPLATAEAEPCDLEVDYDRMPEDKLTYVAVLAMDKLSRNSADPNVRLFSWLFANHLRATDMEFDEVLQHAPIAFMAAAALDLWTVPHPFLQVDAHTAQDQLAAVLEDYSPSRPSYQPFFEVHPFKFMDGAYNDDAYKKEVQTCAPAFVDDESLKAMVGSTATKLFTALRAASEKSPHRSDEFKYKGITFTVHCAMWRSDEPSSDSRVVQPAGEMLHCQG